MLRNCIYFCIILCIFVIEIDGGHKRRSKKYAAHRRNGIGRKDDDCWMTLNAKKHFDIMEALERKYAKVRREYAEQQLLDGFDDEMLGNLLENQGAANREVQKAGNQRNEIPSGINLGGHSMMRTGNSIMFFHRMKLRNNTRFRVNFLRSNFSAMSMMARVFLHDLHLLGNYERVQTTEDPSELLYTPSYGEIEILLRDVYYNMEGRYRMQKDRIYLETVLSKFNVPCDGILMLYTNSSEDRHKNLKLNEVADFLDRLKADLDLWIKDYFNEFLLDMLAKIPKRSLLQYDKERIVTLNRYMDSALKFLNNRLRNRKTDTVKLPNFVINTFNGVVLQLKDGSLSGLDTMYRRSMATNSIEKNVRKVDALISFSSLKARYSYEVTQLTTAAPPLFGSLILSGDELSAILSISMTKKPPSVDLKIDFIQHLKPELLTVEGSVGRIISTFKQMLELHIVSIMTNTMINQVKQLSSFIKCGE